jgi:hypothetical protein
VRDLTGLAPLLLRLAGVAPDLASADPVG